MTRMEKVSFDYSTKNIPIPSKKSYLKRFLEKSEHLVRRMRWAAYFFLNPDKKPPLSNHYGFKSSKSPPPIAEMQQFEEGLSNLTKDITFRSINNSFLKELSKDVKKIKDDPKVIVAADKTANFYRIEPSEYKHLLMNNITKDYKRAHHSTVKATKRAEVKIAYDLELEGRMEVMAEKQAFITMKDHKPNFANRPTCRLINPCKSELGIISKAILDKIIPAVKSQSGVTQWRNTDEVLTWFQSIEDKAEYSFISFDIESYYPSISEDLLKKAMEYASQFSSITDEEKQIIIQAKRSFLFKDGKPWVKKSNSNSTRNFDVAMGSYDGAETCDLVGLYLLSFIAPHFDNRVGLYRDDGLAVMKATPKRIEDAKKRLCAIFSSFGLSITVDANKKVVNFLDVTLNLSNGTYSPFLKPGNIPIYVHSKSNHPPNVVKSIPKSINRRLSAISSNEQVFNNAIPPYQEAIRKSGYDCTLEYDPPAASTNAGRRNRQRNILWFNPPFNAQVQTNVGRKFLKLIKDCFPRNHKLGKIFNKNTIKLSYSCMPNIENTIKGHNAAKLKEDTSQDDIQESCNCRTPATCPLPGRCTAKNIVYQAIVTDDTSQNVEKYIGCTVDTFKSRYGNHKASFDDISKKNATELSKHIWTFGPNPRQRAPHRKEWTIVSRGIPYSNVSKRCDLCLEERYWIMFKPVEATLNKRNQIIASCRHKKKYLISEVKV